MIPALLAVPAVTSAIGGVVGGVMNAFSPAQPAPTSAPAFNPYMNRAATPAVPSTTTAGTLRAEQWGEMDSTSVKTWAQNLAGHHIDATDVSGRTISGVVSGVTQIGNNLALNVGSHLVSLSQLKQVTWSTAAV